MAKKLWSSGVIAVVVMILVGACSTGTASPTPGAPGASATPAVSPAVPTTPTGYKELDAALTQKGADGKTPIYSGKKVSIHTQWIGGEGTNFAASVADFAKATGITIQVDAIASSPETVLKSRIDGGAPPDLAFLAQPTPVLAYASQGKVTDVATFMDANKLSTEHANTIGLVTQNGQIWGIPYKADVKSTIWYPIKAFAAAGYKVPTTWEELITLSDKIVADGKGNPWCVSAGGPGDATGWQITDWVEEVVLKTKGADYYNQWISHQVTFQDAGIKDAFDKYVGKIFFTPNYVYGGNTAIANTDQKTTMDPMFNPGNGDMTQPKCWMQKVPTWYGPDFFPDQRASGKPSAYVVGTDVGIFAFPTIDASQNYVEGSADTVMVPVPAGGKPVRDEVKAVAEFLAVPAGIQNWIRAGSAISTNNTVPADWYAGSYKLKVASDIVNNAKGIGFDASDLMPGAVGSGTFWTQTVAWANNGGTNTDAVLKAIDDSWPPPAQ
jgi:alpha-glucoside transport system substrate-binding protein